MRDSPAPYKKKQTKKKCKKKKLFPSKPELGKKLLPCKSRAFAAQLKLKGRKEQSSCSSNLVIQLQCAPTR